ncbi:Septin-domain-containing protein [Mortierella sp. GBAus27b]|nr:Septin 4 [Mortierella sp. GBA43]KAI8358299.1 Septin-domain-containing protein [Mortierella sp. GBAus27b]
MTGSLPLEIASSLRLVLVGDTGVGKSKSRTLFLNTVPGQVGESSATPDAAADTEQDKFQAEESVSTLEIPKWLLVSGGNKDITDEQATEMVPAENVVLHDFVGYGQTLDARETIDRVDAFLTEQYVSTRNLFGASITPVSTTTRPGLPNTEQQPQPFVEQLLIDAPMAHSLPDACLYFVLYDLKPVDIVFMKRIMHHVNLVPILAKADTLSTNQLWKAKARILKQLEDNQIEFFRFGFTTSELRDMAAEKQPGGPPFALSTSELEVQYAGEAAPSLTDLATAYNGKTFAEAHSDLALLQTLLLGSKNRMLHQASVKKFLNRWRGDLGLPLEENPGPNSGELGGATAEERHQKQEGNDSEQGQGSQEDPPSSQPPQQQQQPQQQQPQQQVLQQQQQQPLLHHQTFHQLPPALQPQTYQPTSSYTPKPSNTVPPPQDEEVAQVVKLNRAQSVARAASKIYTQSGAVPALPSPLTSTPPSLTPPTSHGAMAHTVAE